MSRFLHPGYNLALNRQVYFVRLDAGKYNKTIRIVLVK